MFGEPPGTAFVATGYDTVMLMAQAVKIAGTTEGDPVAKALTSNEFDLLTGKLRYRSAEEGHVPDKAAVLVALDKGQPRFIGWRTPANPPAP
jgi:branched-chain amino acid transport system substrate-binding protein